MLEMSRIRRFIIRASLAVLVLLGVSARAGDSLVWSTNKTGVSVDIKDWDLVRLLKKVASVSGWRIYMEAGTTAKITATFKDTSPDDAIKRLLGDINYTKDATSNGIPRLRVYRTVPAAAVEAMEAPAPGPKDYRIPNELLVRLKRNSTESIDDIAKALGAKIVGRDDKLKRSALQ
jgi:type II secretory pathway component GspD/PulD (secretin)